MNTPLSISGCTLEQYSPLLAAVVTMVATLLGVWITTLGTNRQLRTRLEYERKTERGNIRCEKLEELYELTKNLIGLVSLKHTSARLAIDRNLSKEVFLATLGSKTDPLPRMAVIVNLYFHNIFDALSPVAKIVGGLNRVLLDLEGSYADPSPTRSAEISKDLDDLYQQALNKIHALEKAIFSVSDPELRSPL